jgi:hypothetical protein
MTIPDLNELAGLLAKANLPWSYRPEEHDDWGFIRGPERDFDWGRIGPIVAISREGGTASDHDEHRRNKTDPYEPNGRLIVAAVNALPHLLSEIATLRADLAAAREALRPFAEPHGMGDMYVQFAPRLIQAARKALSTGNQEGGA